MTSEYNKTEVKTTKTVVKTTKNSGENSQKPIYKNSGENQYKRQW